MKRAVLDSSLLSLVSLVAAGAKATLTFSDRYLTQYRRSCFRSIDLRRAKSAILGGGSIPTRRSRAIPTPAGTAGGGRAAALGEEREFAAGGMVLSLRPRRRRVLRLSKGLDLFGAPVSVSLGNAVQEESMVRSPRASTRRFPAWRLSFRSMDLSHHRMPLGRR